MSTVPDVGDCFEVNDRSGLHQYVVTSWMKRRPPRVPYDGPDEQTRLTEQILNELRAEGKIPPPRGAGPDDVPLMWCSREEAEYVCGRGVGGTIQRVADVVVTHQVAWPPEHLEHERDMAIRLIGEPLI